MVNGQGSDTFVFNHDADPFTDADIVRDFSAEDKIRIDTANGDETMLEELLTGLNLRIATGDIAFEGFTSGNDNPNDLNTGIYYTHGTADTSDDLLIMVLEDFSDLTISHFDIV